MESEKKRHVHLEGDSNAWGRKECVSTVSRASETEHKSESSGMIYMGKTVDLARRAG